MHFHDSIEEVSMVLYAHVDPLSSATCRSYHDPSCFTYTTISRHKLLPETINAPSLNAFKSKLLKDKNLPDRFEYLF